MRSIEVYDRSGNVIRMRSIAITAREMKISSITIRKRLADGNWIIRDGYVPVRVREDAK